jgi:hypothetical protein
MNTWSSAGGLSISDILGRYGNDVAPVAAPELAGQLSTQFNAPMMAMNTPGAGVGTPSFLDGMLGGRAADGSQFAGWGNMAVGAASGLMQGYLGLQQLGAAKDSLAQNKKQFELNFGAQKKLTNSRLEDRQASRVAAGGSAYQSVGDYMKKNGI